MSWEKDWEVHLALEDPRSRIHDHIERQLGMSDPEVREVVTTVTTPGESGAISWTNAKWRSIAAFCSVLAKAKGIELEVRQKADQHPEEIVGHFAPDGSFTPTDDDDRP